MATTHEPRTEPNEREAFMAALDRYEDAVMSASAVTARPALIETLRMARRDVMARFDTVLERAGERTVA